MKTVSDNRPPNFVDWDNRPAIIGVGGAYAMLEPNSHWVRVSAVDVANNANVLDEQEWRDQFKEEFGELEPPLELANTRSDVLWHWRDSKK
ncbi:hypothetical protein LGH82_31300 [Mesorhizobium sp. PAMC28654]|uniref:hypothetical protein n=1 Tax=Mesorhizobium sp. PAMC28654 TaxID=2880934 RepID=UPI001D0AD0AD|nr:hypothetical protein [Mesorhizobium sp. PAMC28654]UDL89489.1 hypothetical protein LGH82_31300 [Mesorhizobium sp. PAMC28654]